MRLAVAALILAVAIVAGCGEGSPSGDGHVAVATTAQAGDLLSRVAGDRLDVVTIVGAGADPHDYEPRPSDVAALAEAALIVKSGGELDEWLDGLIEEAGGRAKVVALIDSVRTIGTDPPDPHWWQDPRNAVLAAREIERALSRADPAGRAAYARNADAYVRELRRLDREIAACLDSVPTAQRKLVTTHDSFGYYAARYGLERVGAVLPSLSTQAQPSAEDVDDLVARVRAENVGAIFPESNVDQRLERAVAREAGAELGGALWADSFGPKGSGADTYLSAMAANTAALVAGLSGGTSSCRPKAGR